MRNFILVTGALLLSAGFSNSAGPSLEEIVENAIHEAEDTMEKHRLATLLRTQGDPPSHTYVKFNELTEFLGEQSNLNLETYANLLRQGVDPALALNIVRNQRPDFCTAKLQDCNPLYKYRMVNGTCNNLDNPMWGASYTAMTRLLAPVYTDGYNAQRGGDGVQVPFSLPNARLISSTIHTDLIQPDPRITNMLPQFGQFVDHDLSLVPEGDKRCCKEVSHLDCWPIPIYANDSFFSNLEEPERCMDFTRSTAFCFPTDTGVREQLNSLTSYLDGSNIYGSEETRHGFLRAYVNGKLRSNSDNPNFPPTNSEIEDEFGERPIPMGTFVAGDDRVNEMPGLLTMHILWFREHNRIADEILAQMPHWDDEKVFQEARRLVIAEWQNVVYGEYLPVLLGADTMNRFGLTLTDSWSRYEANVDATIFHAFADAAYRFGHTFINGIIQTFRGLGDGHGSYRIRHNFFVDTQVVQDGGKGYNYILNGLLIQNAQTGDPFVTEDLTNHLLQEPSHAFGSDLIARNLQRGRDHGLPAYMEFRKICGLDTIDTWTVKPDQISEETWAKFESLFENPDQIDLFTGGIVEIPEGDALTGPTFNCLKAMQFKLLKDGDRFFFTHGNGGPGAFWEYQIQHLRKRTFGDIICENSGIAQTQQNVFLTGIGPNMWVSCNSSERARLDVTLFIN